MAQPHQLAGLATRIRYADSVVYEITETLLRLQLFDAADQLIDIRFKLLDLHSELLKQATGRAPTPRPASPEELEHQEDLPF